MYAFAAHDFFIVVTATIAGADGPEDMEKFAERKRGWLEYFVDLSDDVPSHDTIGRVLSLIQPKHFQDAFFGWIQTRMTTRLELLKKAFSFQLFQSVPAAASACRISVRSALISGSFS